MDEFGRVGVLYGGASAEREVSLESGAAVAKALAERGVDHVLIDVGSDPIRALSAVQLDRVFIALHGPGGEDGKIQALLEYLRLPYTGTGVAGSAVAMDKIRTKYLWRGAGLATADGETVTAATDFRALLQRLGGKLVIKPALEGSSLGVSICSDVGACEKAYTEAERFKGPVLAERFLAGPEYTVGILNDRALPVIRMAAATGFYDFHAKYRAEDTQYYYPSGLSADREAQLQELALAAFAALGGRGWGRVDAMDDGSGAFYLLEANTVPGMTSHSLVPMAARAAGLDFADLVLEILRQAQGSKSG